MRHVLILPILVYRKLISPLTPPTCRFRPTCSAYAALALRRHGAVRGTFLAVWRLLRCHPFTEAGEDLVPERPGPDREAISSPVNGRRGRSGPSVLRG